MSLKSYTFYVTFLERIPLYQHCPVRKNIIVLCFIKYQHLKTYEDMKLNIHIFLNSALDANLWSPGTNRKLSVRSLSNSPRDWNTSSPQPSALLRHVLTLRRIPYIRVEIFRVAS
jgi:hypothetical protein